MMYINITLQFIQNIINKLKTVELTGKQATGNSYFRKVSQSNF